MHFIKKAGIDYCIWIPVISRPVQKFQQGHRADRAEVNQPEDVAARSYI